MIISPPFLPDAAAGSSEAAWLDAAMAQPQSILSGTLAPEGSFPLSLGLAWHNGLHLQAPLVQGAYLSVRAIADGEIVFVHAPTTPNDSIDHPLNYNPFSGSTPYPAWTSDGMMVIAHRTEIGAAGTVPTEVVYYSACMHLGSLAQSPRTGAAWKTGDKIYRKQEVGTPGQIYGHRGQVHFEICCDAANLRRLTGRGPDWADPLAPVAPTADGRTDSVFGSVHVYLPGGTPTSTSRPTQHLRIATGHSPANTLQSPQWLQITYDKGSATLRSFDKSGTPIGTACTDAEFEYKLYAEATQRHASLAPDIQAASSPSGWYELLRFGRNLGGDPLPGNAAHWREIPTATGTVWADLNASGTFKFSDADFLASMGWNCFDDDTNPSDQRCDSLRMKTLIRDPDPTNAQRMERTQMARRLGEPDVRRKLRRTICRFPSEWDQASVEARHGWVKTEHFKPTESDGAAATKSWDRFVDHIKAVTFPKLPEDFLKADWRFHPKEFVGVMRKCGWLSKGELSKALDSAPTAGKARADALRLPMNAMLLKYGINNSRLRSAHFLAQVGHETGWWQYREELGNERYFRTMYEVITVAEALADYQSGFAQRLNLVQRGETAQAYATRRPGILVLKAQSLGNGQASAASGGVSGDGPRFRGRGFLQITGRRNYTGYGIFRGRNFTVDPNPGLLASSDFNACDTSGFYWSRERVNIEADAGAMVENVSRIGGIVNRGSANRMPLHDADRRIAFTGIWKFLNDLF
jgi:predicted chitinase